MKQYGVFDRLRDPDHNTPVAALDDIMAAIKAAFVLINNGHAIVQIVDMETGAIHLGWDKPNGQAIHVTMDGPNVGNHQTGF